MKKDIWITNKKRLLEWYEREKRDLPWRKTKDPYAVWISEIMLQQTRVEAVRDYYSRFISELPDIRALASVPEERLLKLWEGLGYYNRARNMQKAACILMEQYAGCFPKEYVSVRALPGIGEYTAGAICSICFCEPTPAVDGNVLRVMARVLGSRQCVDDMKTKRVFREALLPVYQTGNCDRLTQAFMELGATVCIPGGAPKCSLCPLQTCCMARETDCISELPVRKQKKARRLEEKTVFILHVDTQYGIRKRADNGLLAGMWEFPHTDRVLDPQEAMDYITEQGYEPVNLEQQRIYTHVFSHVEWRMTAYYIACRTCAGQLHWVGQDALQHEYALPTAFKYFIKKES